MLSEKPMRVDAAGLVLYAVLCLIEFIESESLEMKPRKSKSKLTHEQGAFQLTYEISKQVVDELKIPDVDDYVPLRDAPFRWRLFQRDFPGKDISVTAEVGTHMGDVQVTFSLSIV